jgi:hypothetical protein
MIFRTEESVIAPTRPDGRTGEWVAGGAKVLELTIPPSILARAHEIIE